MVNRRNRHFARFTVVFGMAVVLRATPISAGPEWYSMGLSDRAVHCILAVEDTNAVFVGTDKGVFARHASEWRKIGDLKSTPKCLATLGPSGDLLAGTSSGLYRYGEPPVGVNTGSNAKTAFRGVKRSPRPVWACSREAKTAGAIFDIRGRQITAVARSFATGIIIVK